MQKVLLLLFSLLYLWNGATLNPVESSSPRLLESTTSTFLMEPLSLISSDLSACETGSATLDVLINGGTGPYAYAWSGPNSFSSTNPSPVISNISSADYGIYTVTVMDSTGDMQTSTLELSSSDGCGEYLLINGEKPVAKYTLDFDLAPPTFNFISDQLVEVTGNVLLNNGQGTDAGFDYTIQLSLEGGPDGSSVINFPSTSPLVKSRFQQSVTKIGSSGGRTALLFAVEGRDGDNPITYMRDPSTKMTFNLSLENSVAFKNLTYELGDMDYNFISSNSTNTCFLGGEPNDFRCRYSYIDRITFLSSPEENDYTFDDASTIHQVNASQMYSQFKDANNNNLPDIADDGRIPGFSPDGNIKICNQAIGSEIKFVYDDPGFGIEGDADGFHDFDAKNQVMGFLSGMTFDLAGECNTTHYMLCDAEVLLEGDPTLTDVVWFNSQDIQVGQGTNLVLDSTSVVTSESFYYTGTNSFGCEERLCCPLDVVRCCLQSDVANQSQAIDLNTKPDPLTVTIMNAQPDEVLSFQWQSNTTGCSETFLNIPGATNSTFAPDTLSATTYYRVLVTSTINGIATCQLISNCITISVMARLGGCISEDLNRDGIQNDGITPIGNIPVFLYISPDTINPVKQTLTDVDGKFRFDSLYGNTYYIQYAPPSNYKLPELVEFPGAPQVNFGDTTYVGKALGFLSENNGLTEKIFVPDAFEGLTYDVLLTPCIPITIDLQDTTIVKGDTLMATVTGPGNYTWTPSTAIDCDTCTTVKLFPTETTTYQVTSGEECVCEGPTVTITVLNELGGCIREDINGDGIANDGSTPMENIEVNLYAEGDTINPIATFITGPDGKYNFDSLPDGKYIVGIIPATDYSFPITTTLPLGDLSDQDGFSEVICLEGGDEELAKDAILGTCPTFELPFREITILPGDTVCVNIEQAGSYSWTPTDNIDCATCQQVKIIPDSSVTYYVDRGVTNAYNCTDKDSLKITVLSELGGCVREDVNRDGVANDGNTAMENIEVNLYTEGDTINPIATAFTNADGKYLFDSLPAGKYYVHFTPENEFYFAPLFNEIGDMVARGGYSDLICLASGDSDIIYDALLERCQSTELSISEARVFSGQEVCVTVSGAGNYTWTPAIPGYEGCDTCTVFKIIADSSQVYTVSSQAERACAGDEAQLDITAAFINLADPCVCLGNKQFGEVITVNSFSDDETWTYVGGSGLHDRNDPSITLPFGTTMTYTGVGANGLHIYELSGIHFDSIGYTTRFSNGELELSIGHTCYETELCNDLPISSIGGCVNEDFNRDGLANDGLPPVENIVVNLYEEGDTINPIGTMLTDADGKYLFDELLNGKYYVSFAAPATYLLSLQDLPVGNLTDRNGYTEVVCVGIGEDVRDVDALIEKCYETELSVTTARAFSGQTVTITVEGGGNYMWTPAIPGYEGCDTCTVFDIVVDSSRTYTVKSQSEFACVGDEAQLDITAAFINIADPCDCLGQKQFGELITINSFSAGETWTYYDGVGYYDRNDANTLVPFGTTMTYVGVGANGFHVYELPGIHYDSIGYTAHFTNGEFQLSISNLCYETDLCRNLPIASLGGCVNEDFNRDGLANDGLPPVENIVVNLYAEGDTINPIGTMLTDVDGKYLFDNLVDGKYYVSFAAPATYLLSLQDLPVGNLTDRNGYTEVVCVGIGEDVRDVDALIEKCYETELSITEARAFSGQTVTVTVEGGGNYMWTPEIPGYEGCDTCTVFDIVVDSSRIYTVKSQSEFACMDDEAQIDITAAFINIADPCDCLGQKQFGELITINSFSAGETWTYYDGVGYYDRNDANTLVPFGTTMTYVGVGANGFHVYELPGIHYDSIGYTAHFTNGEFQLSISNLCYETDLCRNLPIASLGGCVNEDFNRDGLANDGLPPVENIEVYLYAEGDTINPIATTLTDVDGKYLFEGLVDGKYYVSFEAPTDYLLSLQDLPVGNLTDRSGFTEVVCVGIGENVRAVDALIETCYETELSINTASVFAGQTIAITVEGAGNYMWTPALPGYEGCDTCTVFNIVADSSIVYTVKSLSEHACVDDEAQLDITAAFINIADPCVCLGKKQFGELITINSFSAGETWTYSGGTGLSDRNDASTPMSIGTAMTYTGIDANGFHVYEIEGIHFDSIGYTANFSNGTFELSISNLCYETDLCRGLPLASLGGCVTEDLNRNGVIDDTNASFENIVVHLYEQGNTTTPIATSSTGADGKYLFDDLSDGKYFVSFEAPSDYTYPSTSLPVAGNLANGAGFTEVVCIGIGEDKLDVDGLLGKCHEINTDNQEFEILLGESVMVSINEAGNYVWQPSAGVDCPTCQSVKLSPTTTTTYTIQWGDQGIYDCNHESTVTVIVIPCTIKNSSIDISPVGDYPNTVLTANANVDPSRGITYQWQSSQASCDHGFANIAGATNATLNIDENTTDKFFRVIATETGGADQCQLISDCIPLGSLGGCINEENSPRSNIIVNLYTPDNLNTPIASTTTGSNGKYYFDNLPEGKFIIEVIAPSGLYFPVSGFEFGDLAANNGFTDIICVENGEDRRDIDIDMGGCGSVTPIASTIQIVSGETAIIGTTGIGNYRFSTQEETVCDACPSIQVSPSETTTYYISRFNGKYGCSERSSIKIEVLQPYVATSEPCNCYGGFIFEESVTIYSHRANEKWVVSENDGLYFEGLPLVAIPVGTEIPYSGVNEEGMHTYTIRGMHKNEIGYQISFEKDSEGFNTEEDRRLSSSRSSGMTLGNFCIIDEVCPKEETVEDIPEFDPEATPAFPGNVESECLKPNIYAIHGVVIDLMQSGMVEVWAKDFLHKSLHPCMEEGKLTVKAWHTGMLVDLPTTANDMKGMADNLVFTCDHLGIQEIRLFVADEEGNVNFVTTYIIIQDNLESCAVDAESMATISGTVNNWKGEEIQRVNVLTKQTDEVAMGEMTTTNDGVYSFNLPMSSDYTIHPTKDINPLNGVSTFDLVLISKHILGIQTFPTPYQWIAADVNQSGSITAFDMVQIRKLILNIDEQFSNNTSWRFVEKDHVFNATNPLAESLPEVGHISDLHQNMQMDFIGIKIGDVNGSAQPNSLQIATVRTSPEVFTIDVDERTVKQGETVDIVFSTSQLQDVEGYQFTMNYEGLQVNNLTKGLMSTENFGLHLLEKGLLTASWNQSTTSRTKTQSSDKVNLFTIQFQATQAGKLSELLRLQSLPTAIEAYDEEGNILEVELAFNETITSESFEVYQNQPNPFYEETTISFYLPDASEVELILRDEAGRVLQAKKEYKAGGLNTMVLKDMPVKKGFIYYQLNTKFGSKTMKMIQIK